MERPLCAGQTQKKKPCKNKALEGSTLCSTHGGVCTAVNALAQKNRPYVIKKIGTRHRKGLPKTKTPGYVYIFYLENEKGKNFWKIGMTTRLEKRMQEWNKHYGGKATLVQKKLYKSDYCEFMERVIHLYLDYCRMHRYPIHTEDAIKFHSIYSATGKVIEAVDEEERLVAKNKNIEFFHAPIKEIKTVIAFIQKSFSEDAL
jgi:hypothetical protein